MDDLLILINLVQSSKFKSKNLLNVLLEPGTYMRRLYDALATGTMQSDEDVLRAIPELNSQGTSLATIKSKLKERLSDALLFLDFNDADANDRQKAYIDCLKKWAAASVILSKNYRQFGIEKLEQLLRYTRRFEFTEISIDVLQALRLQSSVIFGAESQYREFNSLLDQYQLVRQKEERAETCYLELMIGFGNSRSNKREMAEFARNLNAQIEPYLSECDTYRLQLFCRLIKISIYDNENDYGSLIKLCEESIAFFDGKPYKSFNALQVFHYSLMMSYLNLREYERCRAVAQKYETLFTRGSFNWFKWQELHFLAESHASNYEAAAIIWRKVTDKTKSGEMPCQISDSWKIFEAYLSFLTQIGCLRDNKTDKKFRIRKMLNDIQVAQRDKSGMNIPILVIEYLLALAEGDYAQCIDREESLAKYRTRYLSVSDAARSHYFFRMLEMIPKARFDSLETQQRAAHLFETLRSIPLEAANQNFEVEVVPYETLWNLTLHILKMKGKCLVPAGGRAGKFPGQHALS
jgi:hypothetical protein